MSDTPQNPNDQLWHEPQTASAWKSVPQGEDDNAPSWRTVKALPDDMSDEPAQQGEWHLPRPEDTRFSPDDEVEVSDASQATTTVDSGTSSLTASVSPEDMIDEILGSSRRTVAPPEDGIPQGDAGTERAPAPEDYAYPERERAALDDDASGTMDGLDALESLGALDDEDDDAFTVSEYLALASLEQEAQQSSDDYSDDDFAAEDLSPAQQALFNAAKQASQDLSDSQQLELGEAESEGTLSPDGDEDAASYARRMAQQYAAEGERDEAAQTIGDMMNEGQQREGESAADYAQRMAQQYASGDVDTSPPEGTQPYQPEQTAQQPAGQAQQPQLSPEERELAERFRETRRKVNVLKQQYDQGQIDYNDLENQLRELTILDNQNNWWMLGTESSQWYRYDNAAAEWQAADPPVPLDAGSPRTETGQLDPDEVIAGSLPYLPDTGQERIDEESDYDATRYNQAQEDYTQQYGTDDVDGDTPLPRPGQPQVDPDRTMVGESFDADTLSNQAETVPGMAAVDSSRQQTVPSQPAVDVDNVSVEYPGVRDPRQDPRTAPDYDLEGEQPDAYRDQRQEETTGFLRIAAVAVVVLFLCAGVVVAGGAAYIWSQYNGVAERYEPQVAALANYQPEFQTARILDINGDLITELTSGEGAREPVQIEDGEVSPYFLHAVVSAENETFFEDSGFSIQATLRAFFQNVGSGEIESGGSTITQQVARNLVLQDASVTANRKFQEIVVANRIADQYSKIDVLNLYINETFFGNQSYGVEAAAQFYFEKSAADLNMAESALLAGIIQAPAANDPVINREQSFRAMQNIFRLMLENGCVSFPAEGNWDFAGDEFCISEDTRVPDENGNQVRLLRVTDTGYGGLLSVQISEVVTSDYEPRDAEFTYPHFVNFIQGQVEAVYGENALFQRGFTIYTTLNPRVQDVAQQTLSNRVDALVESGVNTGAVLVSDPRSGAIRALVGSPDFSDESIAGQVDNTRTWQQSGSAIKPIVYGAALEGANGDYYTPATILWDVRSSFDVGGAEPYTPVNFDNEFHGPTPLRFAIQNSYNVPAVKAYNFIGSQKFQEFAARLGLNFLPETQFGLASGLGANDVRLIDMVQAYTTIAANGQFRDLYAIERITERGPDGQEVEVALPERPAPQTAITPQLAYLLQNILSDDTARRAEFPTRSVLTLVNAGLPEQNAVVAKTGTSNDGRDLWTMGFTRNAVVGVWLGTFDNSPTVQQTGFSASAPVWNTVMREAISGTNPGSFENPGGVVSNTICRPTGTLAGENCGNRASEVYLQNQPPPPANEGFVQTINIDSWTGLRANQFCQENVVAQTFSDIDDPFAVDWLNNTNQGQQFANSIGLPLPLQPPPQQECSQGQLLPTIRLANPTEGQTVTENLQITGQISAEGLARWQIELAPAGTQNFQPISETRTESIPQNGTVLTTFDTRQVDNGQYMIRLAAFSQQGGYIFRDVNVTVDNVPPTPTPAPTATATTPPLQPTSPPVNVGTPLPFDEPEVQSTPTATVDPFG